ncbi:MAG: iron chelate uptake ABC transporter family permease subunit, partial [Thermodesulfobacteriota bacterium]|nr:iron chelate uptake ABC transporter family permease subunit [Thermodesulfobacteriota bacterium]
MNLKSPFVMKRIAWVSFLFLLILLMTMLVGISMGSTGSGVKAVLQSLFGGGEADSMLGTIVWQIRFPRVLLSALVGATL